MKLTEQKLREIIKEELNSIKESYSVAPDSSKTKKAFKDKDYGWDHYDLEKANFKWMASVEDGFSGIIYALENKIPMPRDASDAKFIKKTLKTLKSIDKDRLEELYDKYSDAHEEFKQDNY